VSDNQFHLSASTAAHPGQVGASTLGGTARIGEPSGEQAVAEVGSSRTKNALATDYRLACHGAIVGRIANRAKPKLKRISGGLSPPGEPLALGTAGQNVPKIQAGHTERQRRTSPISRNPTSAYRRLCAKHRCSLEAASELRVRRWHDIGWFVRSVSLGETGSWCIHGVACAFDGDDAVVVDL
jgi:hypothetical protein